jgi:Pro-kumamolisin, activation domain
MRMLMLGLLLHWLAAIRCRSSSNQVNLETLLYLSVRRSENHDSGVRGHVLKESIPLLSTRNDLQKLGRLLADYVHQVIFVVRQRNMDELTEKLFDASNPASSNFRRHMTSEEVAELTSNPEARDQIISQLDAAGATIISETLNGEYITANAPIAVWERLFRTEFFTFRQTLRSGHVLDIVRAEEYWIPTSLDMYVDSVFKTVEFPSSLMGGMVTSDVAVEGREPPEGPLHSCDPTDAYGSSLSTQGLLLFDRHCPGTSDMWHNLSAHNQSGEVSGPSSSGGDHSSCSLHGSHGVSACCQAALDLQYLMSSSPGSPTTYWSPDHSLTDWLVDIANISSPPLVLTIGQSVEESSVTDSVHRAFTTQAIKLSAIGVTILASSSADSIHATQSSSSSSLSLSSSSSSGNVRRKSAPSFPSSNPFVTSIGIAPVSTESHFISHTTSPCNSNHHCNCCLSVAARRDGGSVRRLRPIPVIIGAF